MSELSPRGAALPRVRRRIGVDLETSGRSAAAFMHAARGVYGSVVLRLESERGDANPVIARMTATAARELYAQLGEILG